MNGVKTLALGQVSAGLVAIAWALVHGLGPFNGGLLIFGIILLVLGCKDL